MNVSLLANTVGIMVIVLETITSLEEDPDFSKEDAVRNLKLIFKDLDHLYNIGLTVDDFPRKGALPMIRDGPT